MVYLCSAVQPSIAVSFIPEFKWNQIPTYWRDKFCFLHVIGAFCCRCSRWNPNYRLFDHIPSVSFLQMRSYNRHTLVADPYEDGFGDFLLKKQKMIELEKKVPQRLCDKM